LFLGREFVILEYFGAVICQNSKDGKSVGKVFGRNEASNNQSLAGFVPHRRLVVQDKPTPRPPDLGRQQKQRVLVRAVDLGANVTTFVIFFPPKK
jgi:hypothetical protein